MGKNIDLLAIKGLYCQMKNVIIHSFILSVWLVLANQRKEVFMLLLNKTLLKMMKGLKRWILCIVVFRLVVLLGTVSFAQSVSTFLADLFSPSLSDAALYGDAHRPDPYR